MSIRDDNTYFDIIIGASYPQLILAAFAYKIGLKRLSRVRLIVSESGNSSLQYSYIVECSEVKLYKKTQNDVSFAGKLLSLTPHDFVRNVPNAPEGHTFVDYYNPPLPFKGTVNSRSLVGTLVVRREE